jgi:AcrR family transcriptional regulator/predicted DNA-binding transcriptional regulator AlpA
MLLYSCFTVSKLCGVYKVQETEGRPLRISELEKLSGVSRSSIHYYMREGLLSPPVKTGKTMSYYRPGHIKELERIKQLQAEGYPVTFIRRMMDDEREGVPRQAGGGGGKSERRQQIMDRAVELFAKHGYHKTNVTDITRAVGVGHSTFYIYFPDKKALFMECVDGVFQSMFSDVWEEIKHEKDPLERLRKRGEVVLKSHPQFLDMLQVLATMVEDDPRLEKKRREIYASIVEPVKQDLTRAGEMGLIPPVNVDIAAFFVVGFLETAATILGVSDSYTSDDLLDAIESMTFPSTTSSRHRYSR